MCTYHLQEAGATPAQELAFALGERRSACSIACERADASTTRRSSSASAASASSSTRASASSRRCARCARSPSCGTRSRAIATASKNPKLGSFRYGVQVNSLGLTERAAGEQRVAHPDRGAGRDAEPRRALSRAAVAGVERGAVAAAAVGSAVVAAPAADPRLRDRPARVPRPVRGQSGRSPPRSTSSSSEAARARSTKIVGMGGVKAAIETGYMKSELVRSMANAHAAASNAASRSSSA